MGNQPLNLEQDELVTRLIGDQPPEHLPELFVLFGFLGRAKEEGRWRLYYTPVLDRYVEFAEDAVLHHEGVRSPQEYAAASLIWVRKNAELTYVPELTEEEREASYFSTRDASQARSVESRARVRGHDSEEHEGPDTWWCPWNATTPRCLAAPVTGRWCKPFER